MTINEIKDQDYMRDEKAPTTVQNEIQKDVFKEASGASASSLQKQILQLLANSQPVQSVQQTAQAQIRQGYVDVKV